MNNFDEIINFLVEFHASCASDEDAKDAFIAIEALSNILERNKD